MYDPLKRKAASSCTTSGMCVCVCVALQGVVIEYRNINIFTTIFKYPKSDNSTKEKNSFIKFNHHFRSI